jgi:hypothetical protein
MSRESPAVILYDAFGNPVVIANTDPAGTEYALTTRSLVYGIGSSSYSPDPSDRSTVPEQPNLDLSGRMETHSVVTTDEGSFRDDFSGAALTTALAGTLNFTNGSTLVTGTGTAFTTAIVSDQWVKKSADAETLFVQVASVQSDTSLTLSTPYQGTTAGAASVVSNWNQVTATGGSITVATSVVNLASGTTSGQSSYIQRLGDYLPYTFLSYLSITQRIANQTARVGFRDDWAAPTKRAEVEFTGTVNTTVNFVTAFGSAAADVQTTAVTIPNAGTTATSHAYKIDLSGNQATLSIDGMVVATHNQHIPGPYDSLNVYAGIANTGAAGSSTTLAIDSLYFYNNDRVQVDSDYAGEPLPIKGVVKPVYGTSNQALTITLASLATAGARASTAVDNTVSMFEDVLFFVKTTSAAAATSATGYVNIYGYGTVDGGTTYPEAITGTDAGITLSAPPNLVLLAQITVNANAKTYYAGPFSFCRMYGLDRLPAKWGLVFVNQSGATLNATAGNHSIIYQGVNGQLTTP